jgi:hypothetical protein
MKMKENEEQPDLLYYLLKQTITNYLNSLIIV